MEEGEGLVSRARRPGYQSGRGVVLQTFTCSLLGVGSGHETTSIGARRGTTR